MVTASEIPTDTNATAIEIAQTIFGGCVQVTGATFFGDNTPLGIFTDRKNVFSGEANQNTNKTTNTCGFNNLSQFNNAAEAQTFDGAILDIDFIPTGDLMAIPPVVSSKELPDFQNSVFQDFVGVFINGNLVPLNVGDGNTIPENIVPQKNANLFVRNTEDQINTKTDGFTLTSTLTIPVNSEETSALRIGIVYVADNSFGSDTLLAGDSVQRQIVVQAQNNFAPIRIRTVRLGTHGDLMVLPEHRILLRESLAETLFGEEGVFVSAKDLMNEKSIARCAGIGLTRKPNFCANHKKKWFRIA